MPFDARLADRIRRLLARRKNVSERKMFGGLSFMIDGKMCCGVLDKLLVLRLGPDDAQEALKEPHTRPMDFTGRPMKGFVYVEPLGYASDDDLREWIQKAIRHGKSLKPKR